MTRFFGGASMTLIILHCVCGLINRNSIQFLFIFISMKKLDLFVGFEFSAEAEDRNYSALNFVNIGFNT